MVNKQKLKIGIVCYPSVGGSGIVATGLGAELSRLGHEVHFISYEEPFLLDKSLPNVFFHKVDLNGYALFKYPDYTLPLAVKMVEVGNTYSLDIMHVHYAVPHATAALLAKNIAKAQQLHFPSVVTTLHGTDITLLARDKNLMPIIKYSIEDSCGVTAVSESLKQDTLKALSTNKNIKVIHNFYNPKKITKNRDEVRRSLGLSPEDFVVIHLSNLREVKRIPDLLQVIAQLKDEPHLKLLILAGGDFSTYLPLAQKLGIEDKIIIQKNVIDVENYINVADVGLYTSGEESFGMGILETMSYGKPVLATNAGGISEFMQDGQTGFLFNVGAVDDFVQKLSELLKDKELVKKLGDNAQIRASSDFAGEKIVAEYIKYYLEILKRD